MTVGFGSVPADRPPAHPAAELVGQAPDWTRVRRLLVVRLDNLGDVILTTPLLRALRAALPAGARLDLLASPAGSALVPLLEDVDDVLAWRAVWQDARAELPVDPERELALVDRLRGYDVAVISTSFSQSPWPVAYAAYLAGVPVRVGQSREFGGSLLTHWLTPAADDEEAHQVDRALRLAAALGVAPQGTHLSLRHPDVPPPCDEPYVLVLPGASAPARRYPRLGAVVQQLRASGLRVFVVGTAKEADLVHSVAAGVDELAGVLDVPGLAAAVAAARVVVTNNSAGMHLADAYRVPQVTLFAGTERVSQYAPRSGPARVLTRPTWCRPCRAFVCPYEQECLDIAPEEVVDGVLAGLAHAGSAA